MSKIKVNFLVDNNPLYSKKVDSKESISVIRNKYNIPDELLFQTNDKFDILKEDEKDYTIEDCLVEGNSIFLKTEIKLNVPKKESEFIKNQNNLDLYLYPETKLTKEEEEKSIVLMVVGQTGSGKTTLLNAYINYLMGINYEDNFRYIMINEKFEKKAR